MKRCSTLFIIREMQIKTPVRYHLTQVRMTISKKSTNSISKVTQLCPTPWNPMDCSLQARVLEWVAISFSRGSSQPRDQTPWTVASRQEYWSGLPFPSPRDLPNPGIKPGSPAFQADSLTSEPPGKPLQTVNAREDAGKREPSFTIVGDVN